MTNLFSGDSVKPTTTVEKSAAPDLTPVETVNPPAVIEATTAEIHAAPARVESYTGVSRLMSVGVAEQNRVVAEFVERRQNLQKRLLEILKRGVHYGNPPGCEVEVDADGNMLVWSKKAGKKVAVPKEQWQSRPTLYKRGAHLICDLYALRAEFSIDADAQKMMEGRTGFAVVCRLIDRDGRVVSEGRGVQISSAESTGDNGALKKAQKRAQVDATIRLPIISDLFDQDMNDPEDAPPAKDNPNVDTTQPVTPPRAERVVIPNGPIVAEVTKVYRLWCSKNNKALTPDAKKAFIEWASGVCGGPVPFNGHEWKLDMVTACNDAMKE